MRPGCYQWSVVVVQGVMAYKLNIGISVLTWKNVFTVRVMKHWNRLPREDVESVSVEIFETCVDAYLCDLL